MAQATLLTYFKPRSLDDRLAVAAPAYEHPQTHNNASKLTEQDRLNRYQGSESANIHSSLSPDVFSVPASTNVNVRFSAVESVHLESIKRLTSSILPVRYPNKFFEEVITDATVASLSKIVHYDDRPVGWIRCRLETNSPSPSGQEMRQIYIQALCILAPYRNSGYATRLVDSILQPHVLTENNVTFVYAHVWENNEDALAWYEKRGFKRTMLVDKYYSRLRPNGAWIVKRDVSQRPQASHGSRSHPTLPLCSNKSMPASIQIVLDSSLHKSSVIIREPRNQQPFPVMPSEFELQEWFCYNICEETLQQRVRSIPNISAGKCILCEEDVMTDTVPSTIQCSICLRFTVSAPILTASRLCSCRCSCHNDSAAAADEMFVDDPEPISKPVILAVGDTEEGVRKYRAEAGSNLLETSSRRSSTSSMWSNCAPEFAIGRPELERLHYGLNFWDIHDLTMSTTGERLERQFPEINEVHAINLTEQEAPLIPAPVTCRVCKRHYHMNVTSALQEGLIRECEDCSHPILRASERTMEDLVIREQTEACRCICRCDDLETEEDSVPCYLPFAGEPRVNPAPWVREILQDRGFCLGDRCGNGLPCSVDRDNTIPSFQQIVAGTYREHAHNHHREVAEEYAAYRASATFPNGIPKSRETDSGLPVVLENYFHSVDPEAFGRAESQISSRQDGASRRITASSDNENQAQDQFPPRRSMIRLRSDLSDSDTRRIEELHAWLLWNDWRIEDDDDNQSVCTADGLSVSRDEWEGQMVDAERSGEIPRALEAHHQRHLFRRYQRIARLGGFQATIADIWEVVDAEIEFEESESAREAEFPVWILSPSSSSAPSEAHGPVEPQAQSQSLTQSQPTTQHQTQQAPSTQEIAVSLLIALIGGLESAPEEQAAAAAQGLRDLLARGRDAVFRAFNNAINEQFGFGLQDAIARGLTVGWTPEVPQTLNTGRFAIVDLVRDNVGMGEMDHVSESTPES